MVLPEGSGNPGDKWGWAAMAGFRLNTPWLLNWFGSGAGDNLQLQGIYTEGAVRYIMQNPSNNNWWIQNGFNTAYGVVADGVYGGANLNAAGLAQTTATGINLTTAWGLNASYEHFWTPQWRTSLYGGWTSVSYNSQANNILCCAARLWRPALVRWRLRNRAATTTGPAGGLAPALSGT